MKTIYNIIFILFCVLSCTKDNSDHSTTVSLNTKMDSVSYGLGVNLGTQYKNQEFHIDTNLFYDGFITSYSGEKSLINEGKYQQMLRDYYMEVRTKKSEQQKILTEENKVKSENFLSNNKSKSGVIELERGLQYKIIRSGTGESPTVNETVKVHYIGKKMDGTVFDSSREKSEPIEFSLRSVIKGWTEALQLMRVGSHWELYIPPGLGYGRRGSGGKIGPNEVLIFDVELIDIVQN